jgi:NRPS condensation-like uncharacterized protein
MIERFALADELTCYYDRPSEPANVHLEVHVPARLDPAMIRAAASDVLAAQPRIMARRRPASWRRGYHWEFPAPSRADLVLTVGYRSEEDLDGQRDEFLSRSPSLDLAPPLQFLHAWGSGGDFLMLNAHHAAFDGLSCLRLMRAVAAAYSSRIGEDPAPSAAANRTPMGYRVSSDHRDGTSVFNLEAAHGAAGTAGHGREGGKGEVGGWVGAGRGPAARISPGAGGDRSRPGYGAHLVSWDGLIVTESLRSAGLSVNDLLIAALMVTIGDWNHARRGSSAPIKITMPVGDKNQAGSDGRWANLSRLTTISARVPQGAAPAGLIADVARQTRAAKEHSGAQLDLGSRALAAAPLPVAVKHMLLRIALTLAGPFLCDTSLISNLGVAGTLAFGATPATQVWFSTSAHMPRGLSMGVVTAGGVLRLTFRYRRALMSGADAAEFARMYVKVLDQFAGQEAVRR